MGCCINVFAGDDSVEVLPAGIKLNYFSAKEVPQGIEVGLLFRAKDGGELSGISFGEKGKGRMPLENIFSLSGKDGKKLGKCRQYYSGMLESGQKNPVYYFVFDEFPVLGEKRLNLTGQFSAHLLSAQITTEAKTVTVRKGEAIRSGIFSVAVGKIDDKGKGGYQHQVELIVEPGDKKIQIPEMLVTDREGRTIDCRTRPAGLKNTKEGLQEIRQICEFRELPEEFNISFTYRYKKEIEAPIDVVFDL